MSNPFPGMNPYIENPLHWRSIHNGLIHCLQAELNRTLPREFVSRVEDRVYVEEINQSYYPDALIVQKAASPVRETGGVAVRERAAIAAPFDAPRIVTIGKRTVREPFIAIRAVGEGELIAVVEFLSPTNKDSGPGRGEYLRKQADLLSSAAHLLEIDLLRGGEYTVAPKEASVRRESARFDYIISLHRGGMSETYEVWPVALRDCLPRLRLPLTEDAGDVYPDLQSIVERAYEDGGGDRDIDYREEPIPPLSSNDAAWADSLLREKGLR